MLSQIYAELAQVPSIADGSAALKAEEDAKKAAQKAKKSVGKGKAGADSKKTATSTTKNADDEPMKVVDEDPNGEKLAATFTPVAEARKFLGPLEREAGSRLETWCLSFDLAMAGREWLSFDLK